MVRAAAAKNHDWSGIEELSAVMFSDAKHIQTNLVGKLHFFQQMLHALDGLEGETGGWVGDGCGEAVDAELHLLRRLLICVDGWMIRVTSGNAFEATAGENGNCRGQRIKSGVAAVILPSFL